MGCSSTLDFENPDVKATLDKYVKQPPNFNKVTGTVLQGHGKILNESELDNYKVMIILISQIVGLYFSAHWCDPCRDFTPKLAEFYQEVNKTEKNLEIIYISSDQTEEEFQEYFSTMPWLAIEYNDPKISQFIESYGTGAIPSLVILKRNGKTFRVNVQKEVRKDGIEAYYAWLGTALGMN